MSARLRITAAAAHSTREVIRLQEVPEVTRTYPIGKEEVDVGKEEVDVELEPPALQIQASAEVQAPKNIKSYFDLFFTGVEPVRVKLQT